MNDLNRRYEKTKRQARQMVREVLDEYPRLKPYVTPDYWNGTFVINLRDSVSARAWLEYNSLDHTDWSFRWYNTDDPAMWDTMHGRMRLRMDTAMDGVLNLPIPYGLEMRNGYLWTDDANKVTLMIDYRMNGISFEIDLWKIGTALSTIHDKYYTVQS